MNLLKIIFQFQIMLNKVLENCKSYICTDDIKTDLKEREIKVPNQSTGKWII